MTKFKLWRAREASEQRRPLRGFITRRNVGVGSPVDASVLCFVETGLPPPFAMIATAPGAAPKAVSALRRAVGCRRAVQAQERQEPALLRTASVQAPGPAQSPTSVVTASGMKALLQARSWAKARLLTQ
jgi:hypothetical protein